MQSVLLHQLEAGIERLPLEEQLWLMERLAQHIRRQAQKPQLAAMAQDPEVQQELRRIEAEFAQTEGDGLDAAA